MKKEAKNHWVVRQLEKGDRIPYDLLLLAEETMEALNQYIFDSDLYVIEREGIAIAVYALYPLNPDEMEIKNIAVAKAFQGQGIGRFLLRDATDRAKERKCTTIIIGTADVAIRQLKLYRTAGFVAYEIKKDFFTSNYPAPIFEGGIQLKNKVMLKKAIQ